MKRSSAKKLYALKEKSPLTAGILGILVVGLGHLYLGKFSKAVLIFLAALVVMVYIQTTNNMPGSETLALIIMNGTSAIWAYGDAKDMNSENRIRLGLE